MMHLLLFSALFCVLFLQKSHGMDLDSAEAEKIMRKNVLLTTHEVKRIDRIEDLIEVTGTIAAPTSEPTSAPTSRPSSRPSTAPTARPSSRPSTAPSARPSSRPSSAPSSRPSSAPTSKPTAVPTSRPTSVPSSRPTAAPSGQPTSLPTGLPTTQPSSFPSGQPSSVPSCQPSGYPSGQPTGEPTAPSFRPTFQPYSPTHFPTIQVTPVVTISTTYTIGNVDSPNINDVSQQTIEAAINQIAPKPSTVKINSISLIEQDGRRLGATNHIREGITATPKYTYAVNVTYILNLIDYPGFDHVVLANRTATFIRNVAINGTFQTVLIQLAQTNTATQLLVSTVDGVDIELFIIAPPTFSPTKAPQTTNTATLTDGQIAGLIIGTVIGSCCLLTLLYYAVNIKRSRTKYDYTGQISQQSTSQVLGNGGIYEDTVTIYVDDKRSAEAIQI